MLFIPEPKYRKRREVRGRPAPTPPPVALTLVGASYDVELAQLTLVFDRAVSVAGYDGTQVVVDDFANDNRMNGAGSATVTGGGETVLIDMMFLDTVFGSGVVLNATGLTGIVAADDGGRGLA